jgi:hypothetical protein
VAGELQLPALIGKDLNDSYAVLDHEEYPDNPD